MKIAGFIPARLDSTRLPKKLLLDLKGKTILEHTWLNAKSASKLENVFILTENEEIFQSAKGFGADVYMTPKADSGTERIAKALEAYSDFSSFDLIVNIQGDEPFIPSTAIEAVADCLLSDSTADLATAACPLKKERAYLSSSVKIVFNKKKEALYFSRSLMPGNKELKWRDDAPYYEHIGIYAYRKKALSDLLKLPASPLQEQEDLEQLKALEYGYKIKIAVLPLDIPSGIDTHHDFEQAKKYSVN